jgi:hypothetical protein
VLQPTVFNARAVRGPFVEAGREVKRARREHTRTPGGAV